jgi:hypothetical protein
MNEWLAQNFEKNQVDFLEIFYHNFCRKIMVKKLSQNVDQNLNYLRVILKIFEKTYNIWQMLIFQKLDTAVFRSQNATQNF